MAKLKMRIGNLIIDRKGLPVRRFRFGQIVRFLEGMAILNPNRGQRTVYIERLAIELRRVRPIARIARGIRRANRLAELGSRTLRQGMKIFSTSYPRL